jgi:hypothetical protein
MLALKRSLLNREQILINVLKALASIISKWSLHVILLPTFIQCTMTLMEPKSVRKLDGMSLIFIDFYVPALTPRLSSTETSLQLSDNIRLFAVCRIYTGVISKET